MAEKGMTVKEAAHISGASASTIVDWRAGGAATDYVAVKRLAHALGVTLSFLLTGEDDTRPADAAPTVTEVFEDGGALFDGYAKITIQRLIPKIHKPERKNA